MSLMSQYIMKGKNDERKLHHWRKELKRQWKELVKEE